MTVEKADKCANNRAAQLSGGCDDDKVATELVALGERGELIAHAREQALEILQGQNGCAAWFQESEPDAAEVFRSLHYELDRAGISYIESRQGKFGVGFLRHPWGAMASQNAGSNSTIYINGNGAFFSHQARMTDSTGGPRAAWHRLTIGFYEGDTREARVTILLHELGHVIGRLPEDSDSWNGQSAQNTTEVLRHCYRQIDLSARRDSHFGD